MASFVYQWSLSNAYQLCCLLTHILSLFYQPFVRMPVFLWVFVPLNRNRYRSASVLRSSIGTHDLLSTTIIQTHENTYTHAAYSCHTLHTFRNQSAARLLLLIFTFSFCSILLCHMKACAD